MVSLANAFENFKPVSSTMLDDLHAYLEPYAAALPDARFRETLHTFVPGMLAARSPQVTKAAAHAPNDSGDSWALAKRTYRMITSDRYSYRDWARCLYANARRKARAADPDQLVVALDPVNFEKAYAKKIEGISQVYKSTPPGSVPNQDA